eukprot:CAMPEP_0113989876 /NCGR_PEP_ID=MMETSP0328-20130328/8266_1 /TAXON_ID=39455 /ORGANISM="Alexandrium minutum" /LENGTH=36 /assembly_acc=CAM_ASM_000350
MSSRLYICMPMPVSALILAIMSSNSKSCSSFGTKAS